MQELDRKKRMIVVNALVEWILISLLLINSLFTYLITKYAHFFGLNLRPNTTISLSHNHAAAAAHSLPTPNSQHMCQQHNCSMVEKDVIERDVIEEEELDTVDGDNNDHELEEEEANNEIVSDVDTFSFREEEDECSKEDAYNHNILLQLHSTHLEPEEDYEDDSLQLIHLHCSTHSLRPVPLDLIDSFIFRAQHTMDTASTVHLFQQESDLQLPHPEEEEATKLHNQEDTPLQLEADVESSQLKLISYRQDSDSTNGEQESRENEAETPTSLDSLHNYKLLLVLSEKRDSSSSSTSVEECLDGSIDKASVTVERLKSALTSERKTLRAVYSELEEERSASAIAANHTMAMITRLQEEKAAMQMEALQYHRMMEEQAEYDQEALQLLNQLMLNKEKEKDELAQELEMYRENLIEGEHTDDDDDEDLEVMALDCMKHMSELDESLAEFEEEKLSILDQLKALEDKLLMMSGGGSQGRSVEDNDIKHVQKETMQSMAKQLLPLLDEAEEEEESAEIMEINLVEELPDDDDEKDQAKKLVDGVEEVDRVYERLKALEEENVKEDKAEMNHLLREIMQNLRDLKTVELQVQSTGIKPQP